LTAKTAPTAPANADELIDTCARILQREALRLERKRFLTADQVDLVVRVAKAAAEIVALQLDPLGPKGRKRLERMSDAELAEARQRLEARS
jgi:hypothetical protein